MTELFRSSSINKKTRKDHRSLSPAAAVLFPILASQSFIVMRVLIL